VDSGSASGSGVGSGYHRALQVNGGKDTECYPLWRREGRLEPTAWGQWAQELRLPPLGRLWLVEVNPPQSVLAVRVGPRLYLDPARCGPRLCSDSFLRETPLPLVPVDGHNVAVSVRGKGQPAAGTPRGTGTTGDTCSGEVRR